ncbi:MAG: hypothetical protein HXS44_08240 [Theionarchaea archaeon]|nr:hypothetical protein [Theionarchaea archaeon]
MKRSIILVVFLLLSFSVYAQEPEFIVREEYAEIYIYDDATVEIWYYLTIETTSGPQRGIYIGIPTSDVFDFAASQNGRMLKIEKETNRLKIYFSDEVQTGAITDVKVSFFVEEMIYPDEEGQSSMEFIPAWWDRQRIDVLRVKFILPEGCDISDVGHYPPTAENRGMEDGRAFVYFERANLDPGYRFRCGVSFPDAYVISIDEDSVQEGSEGSGIIEKTVSEFENSPTTGLIIIIGLIIIGIFLWRLLHRE